MNEIQQHLVDRHTHDGQIDKEQLEVIFSRYPQLVVEAPAGYGKTKTMVSKTAYILATNQILYPKKILSLTFSINAAFKIRNDITQQLPKILSSSKKLSLDSVRSIYTTNYHGLCRRILKRYGYLISSDLSKIDSLKGVAIFINDDRNYSLRRFSGDLLLWGIGLTNNEIDLLYQFTKSIKDAGNEELRVEALKTIRENLKSYLQIVKQKFLPKGYILFDSILLFVRLLFHDYPEIRNFYRGYFPTIFVDEFQDTNILQWSLLQDLIGRDGEYPNQLFLFGDQYQKIYEFIGAMQGLIDIAKLSYEFNFISLLTNHRFMNNPKILLFDENIRKIARSPANPQIQNVTTLEVFRTPNQNEEGKQIVAIIQRLVEKEPGCTIAILTRAGKENQNTIKLVEYFNSRKAEGFTYFFALYSDEDQEYIDFHRRCESSLYANILLNHNFLRMRNQVCQDMRVDNPSETWTSLQILLDTFFKQITEEYRFLSLEEKTELVIDVLHNNALKQYLMYVKTSQITLSTIHGSKGLEWDYVVLPDMEKSSFPSYPSLCKVCGDGQDCQPDWKQVFLDKKSSFLGQFKEEINVFYVGGTRARKAVYFTYSDEGLNTKGEKRDNLPSCFLKLEGLQINLQ